MKQITFDLIKFNVDDDDDNLERVNLEQIPKPESVFDTLIVAYGGFCGFTKAIDAIHGSENEKVWNPEQFSYFKAGRPIPPRFYFVIESAKTKQLDA